MSLPFFGFGPNQGDSNGGEDLSGKIPLFSELQKLLSWSGGPVNWDLARQIATAAVATQHRAVTATESAAVDEALRLADMWLDDATDLPSGITTTAAWSRVEWIEKTLPTWGKLCDPVAERVVGSMSATLPAEVAQMAGPLSGVMNQFGGLMFGAQVGQGIGALSAEVVGSTDVGLPLSPSGTAVLIPQNVEAFGEGLELPAGDVRLYLALREAIHHRLFAHVPWLRGQLLDLVASYARGIQVDPAAIQQAMTSIDPANPESMQSLVNGDFFSPADTPEQVAALRRLETLLALIEGWVDTVVAAATNERMPAAGALRETTRRLRASGGPAEETFATLVGLELRPRRLRDAAALWWAVGERHDVSTRDRLWEHPDLMPNADDLDDPIGFAQGLGVTAELEELMLPTDSDDEAEAESAANGQENPPTTQE